MMSVHKHLCALALTLAAICATPVAAKENPAPSVAKILAESPSTEGVFTERMDGSAWHIQSGVTCPLTYTNVNLWHLKSYDPQGSDVGCDYGRSDENGAATAKLTVFVVKAQEGDTVETAFARYQTEVKDSYPDLVVKGPVMGANYFPGETRSEAYEFNLSGHLVLSTLVVGVREGWIIEIRGTRLLDASDASQTASGDQKAVGEAVLKSMATIGSRMQN